MKLAEALAERAELLKQIEQFKARLARNAKVQQGEVPSEDPAEILAAFEGACADLERLIRRINRTNLATETAPGATLTDLLARRDVLRVRMAVYRDLAQAASITQDRYSRSEIKFVSAVDVRTVQATADRLSKEFRMLDTQIQALNWTTDLIE